MGLLRFKDRMSVPSSLTINWRNPRCPISFQFKLNFVIRSPFGRLVVGCHYLNPSLARRSYFPARPWVGQCDCLSGSIQWSVTS